MICQTSDDQCILAGMTIKFNPDYIDPRTSFLQNRDLPPSISPLMLFTGDSSTDEVGGCAGEYAWARTWACSLEILIPDIPFSRRFEHQVSKIEDVWDWVTMPYHFVEPKGHSRLKVLGKLVCAGKESKHKSSPPS